MLTKRVVTAIGQAAENNTQANVCLNAKDSTPLHDIIVCMGGLDEPALKNIMQTVGTGEALIANSMEKDVRGESQHDVMMAQAVRVASDSVRTMLNVARTMVLPTVKTLYAAVDRRVADVVGTPNRHPVLTIFLEDVYNSPTMAGLIERFSEAPLVEPKPSSAMYPELDGLELAEKLITGISRFDGYMATILDDTDPALPLTIYNAVFRASGEDLYGGLSNASLNRRKRFVALITQLIAKSFLETPPEQTVSSLAEFNDNCSTFLQQSGRTLYRAVKERERLNGENRLITFFPQPGNTNQAIEVVGEVYNRWLEDGGSPELLMGACLSGDRETTYSVLLENKDRYVGIYNRAEQMHKSKAAANRTAAMVNETRRIVSEHIRGLSDTDTSVIDPKDVLLGRLGESLSVVTCGQSTDCYCYVREVVCNVFYPHTNALSILKLIDEAIEENPKLTVREAGTVATIDIVATWVSSMIDVKRYR